MTTGRLAALKTTKGSELTLLEGTSPRWRDLFLGLTLLAGQVSASSALPLTCDQAVSRPLSRGQVESISIQVESGQSWVLTIEERGADAEIALDSLGFEDIALRPPRYGFGIRAGRGEATLRLRGRSGSSGSLGLALNCRHLEAHPTACIQNIERHYRDGNLAGLTELRESSGPCPALAAHARAALQSRQGRFSDAAKTYRQAESAWLNQNDARRAAITVLGVLEQLVYEGRYEHALALAPQLVSTLGGLGEHYYSARVQVARAVASWSRQESADALAALLIAEQQFTKLDEQGELANVHYNKASILRALGERKAAAASLRIAMSVDDSLLTPIVRGRIALLNSSIELLNGNPSRALASLDEADTAFESGGLVRWQVKALLDRSSLYRLLGMSNEARSAVASAVELTDVLQNPRDFALSLVVLADVERSDHRLRWARLLYRSASTLLARLELSREAGVAQLNALTVGLQLGQTDLAGSIQALERAYPPAYEDPKLCLLHAELALRQGLLVEAGERLASRGCEVTDLDGYLHAAVLRSRFAVASGEDRLAVEELLLAARRLRTIALTSNALVYYGLTRKSRVLRDALAALAHSNPASVGDHDWFELAMLTHPLDFPARSARTVRSISDDVANLLLADEAALNDAERVLSRSLLARLATPTEPVGMEVPTVLSLTEAQRQIPANTALLVFVPAEPISLAIWLEQHAWRSYSMPGRAQLQQSAGQLSAALGNGRDELLWGSVANLSTLLLDAGSALPPEALWVLADETLGAVPWSLLRWPGSERPMLDSTAVSWVSSLGTPDPAIAGPEQAPSELHVLTVESGGHLPRLPFVSTEARVIDQTSRLPVVHHAGALATSETFLRLLQSPTTIVHVGSHGEAQAARVGRSGIWLRDESDDAGLRFLSWLDLVDSPLQAQLLVLNACDLASGPATMNGAISFAASLSAAGVIELVAADRPLSDAATATWVPVFYHALFEQDDRSGAQALRQAQLAMARSPRFRHPRHWASLQHFRRL